jgi:hypothetical protein
MKLFSLIFLLFVQVTLLAQNKQAKLFEQFISISNSYKQLPLQLQVQLQKTNNIILQETDTTNQSGFFQLQKNGAFISFGDFEQLITDSIVLITMPSIEHIIVMEETINVSEALNQLNKMSFTDTAMQYLLDNYTISQNNLKNDQAQFLITHKKKLGNSTHINEEIVLTFNSKTKAPLQVQTIKRSLIKKPENGESYDDVPEIKQDDKNQFYVRIEENLITYKSIQHQEGLALPYAISDRVVKGGGEGYTPIKAFAHYKLSVN